MATKQKNEAHTLTNDDPFSAAKNALAVYNQMKQSMSFFNQLIDYHIQDAKKQIATLEKAENEALKKHSDEIEQTH